MRYSSVAFFLLGFLLSGISNFAYSSDAEHRIALLIGNNKYSSEAFFHLGGSPYNDVEAMSQLLQQAGFKVYVRKDADKETMLKDIAFFTQQIRPNTTSLLYFSGHGAQEPDQEPDVESGIVKNKSRETYLIPVNTPDSPHIEDMGKIYLSLNEIYEIYNKTAVDPSSKHILILDSCRNDLTKEDAENNQKLELARARAREGIPIRSKSGKVRRAQIGSNSDGNIPAGMVMVYSVEAGDISLAIGELSNYTAAFISAVKPGLPFTSILRNLVDATAASDSPSSHTYGGEKADVAFSEFFLLPGRSPSCGWGGC